MPAQVAGEFTRVPQTTFPEEWRNSLGEPGLRGSRPGPFHLITALLYYGSQSTHRVQGLEFLPQVSHSTLLVCVCRVPGTFFLGLVLFRLLETLTLSLQSHL